jgi:hypothetical protein
VKKTYHIVTRAARESARYRACSAKHTDRSCFHRQPDPECQPGGGDRDHEVGTKCSSRSWC